MRLKDKVAIITAAGSGMGREGAILFAKEGAKVVANDCRKDGSGEETVKMIKEAGGDAIYIHADISKAEDVRKLIKTTVDTYGKLDILVNNAGVQRYKPLEELTEDDFDFIVSTNFKGVWLTMKYALPEQRDEAQAQFNFAEAAHLHFSSVTNQVRFTSIRNALLDRSKSLAAQERAELIADMKMIVRDEIEIARRLFALTRKDSRIGYEASNHYYYLPVDLMEKAIDCQYILDHVSTLYP